MANTGDSSSKILVGVDGSATALRAGAYAAGVAQRQHALLIVAFIEVLPRSTAFVPESVASALEGLETWRRELQARVLSAGPWLGVHTDFVSVRGDPYTELTRIAEERQVDLVVVGASESSRHRYIGSVALKLVRAGRWPVTIVP